ncbi:MAG: YmdB family metallophosphoesterase [Oscillibacter sp.]|nr:YmdB family metallophosphoesterase [Oscillibacter sp.]
MLFPVLAIGDVTGEAGLCHLERRLRAVQRHYGVRFTVVNGENASSFGLTCEQARRIYDAGADAVTLGNHAFGRPEIATLLDEAAWLLRPANLSPRKSGHGCEIFDLGSLRVRVMTLIGRCDLEWNADNPFTTADRLLAEGQADFTLLDFHAQATSEKLAMAYYLDGRVSAMWGTHTHVPTADEQVFAKGTGYLTDLGMTGPIDSVLGVESAQSVEHFLGGLPGRYRNPDGPCKMQGAVYTLDTETGLCRAVERIDIR